MILIRAYSSVYPRKAACSATRLLKKAEGARKESGEHIANNTLRMAGIASVRSTQALLT